MDDAGPVVDLGIEGLGPGQHIGRGGFADVYRAEQLSLGRTVAVKILREPATAPEAEARFRRECLAIGAVTDHPHIVGVHQGGFTGDGRAYLVMEYLPGGSLADRLRTQGPMPVPEAVSTVVKIARALAVAHRAGVLHRDVKPANIMISAYGEPALADFGIARVEGAHQTATGLVTASIAHAAPEALEGRHPTTATDIYSLGSTLHELCLGMAPHHQPGEESVWPLMRRVISDPVPDLGARGLGPALAAVLERMLAKDPSERHQDAEEVAEELSALFHQPGALVLHPVVTGDPPADGADQSSTSAETPTQPLTQTMPSPPDPGSGPVPGGGSAPAPASAQAWGASEPTRPQPMLEPSPGPDLLGVGPPGSAIPSGPRQPSNDRETGGRAAVLVASIIAVLALAGTTFGLLLPALDDSGSSVDEDLGPAPEIRGETGPLVAGRTYQLDLALDPGTSDQASFRLLLDGQPVAEAVSVLPDLEVPAGVHRLAVETDDGGQVLRSAPLTLVAIGATPEPGVRAQLARVPTDPANWPLVIEIVDSLQQAGHERLEVLDTAALSDLSAGVWMISAPDFVDAEAAESYCQEFELAIPERCHAAPIGLAGQ